MAPKKFRKLPSARAVLLESVSTYRFLDIFFVHFSKLFRVLNIEIMHVFTCFTIFMF